MAPLTVRLSPSERESLRQKADRAGLRVSDGARAAFEAWEPAAWTQSEAPVGVELPEGE